MKGEMILDLRDGNLIPNSLKWDDREISDILHTINQINGEQAKKITRSLRESLETMGLNEIRLTLLEQIINGKMLEYGFTDVSPIHLNQQLFTRKNRLSLSENAIVVLKKRYLKKDNDGKVMQEPNRKLMNSYDYFFNKQ